MSWSFAIPDGFTMDPMAPTAMAISTDFMDRIESGLTILKEHGKKMQKYVWKNTKFDILKKTWNCVVTVVLIEAKDLPSCPPGGSNGLYCKFKLGSETHKSKITSKTCKPTWRERFNLYLYEDNNLNLTLWHKGKQKYFMGRTEIDLSQLEKERTHDLWQELECGFGSVHLLVTLSGGGRPSFDRVLTSNGIKHKDIQDEKYAWYKLDNDWSSVGQLSVTVHCAKGLATTGLSRPDAFCVLEVDNNRIQTPSVSGTSQPHWNKNYTFELKDITSALDVTVYDEAIINTIKGEILGKITIPLLRINNEEKRWYALKDNSKKKTAKGSCPRILLEMTVTWNPIKASLRLLSPRETKYVKKTRKFDVGLIYSNVKFIKDIFHFITELNGHYIRLFEWESTERSAFALCIWLIFWYIFRFWMTPLLLTLPFIYRFTGYRSCNNVIVSSEYLDDESEEEDFEQKDDKTIKTRINGLQDLTFTIKDGIDYIVSMAERIKNLVNFTVPYLSYVAITVLVLATFVLYLVPINYLFMGLGIYKFTRKYLNPERTPNNDILDFLSRVPDNNILKQWRELKVPEPNLSRSGSLRKMWR